MPPELTPAAEGVTTMQQETTNSAGVAREMTVARWLFNPFVRIGGEQALAIGLTVIVVSGLVAAAGGVHFDGLLDFHPGYRVSFWVPVVEGLVNWSVISVLLGLVSLPRRPANRPPRGHRGHAGAGAVAAASRRPGLRTGAGSRGQRRVGRRRAVEGRMVPPQTATLVAGLLAVACAIWMVWLMWKAFAVSCNQRGGRAVAMFVAAVIAGEVATKFLLAGLLGGSAAVGAQGGG